MTDVGGASQFDHRACAANLKLDFRAKLCYNICARQKATPHTWEVGRGSKSALGGDIVGVQSPPTVEMRRVFCCSGQT
jgi:hypothetical protein